MKTINVNNDAARLGTESITKLIRDFALPAIAGLVVVSLYNIIDRIFIGQGVGPMAIAGLALTFPISNIVAAIGTLVGVGAASRLSIVLGKHDYEWGRNIVAHVPMLSIIFSSIFITFGLIYLDELIMLFGGSENTISYARDYLKIVIPASVFTNICFSLSSIIRGAGNPKKSMYVIFLGVILNIILDPIFIFGFGMGIEGVALATAISMFCGAIYAMSHFMDKNNPLSFRLKNFKLKKQIVKNIVSIGMSPFAMNFASCFVVIVVNIQLQRTGGDLAMGAFSIVNSYLMLIVMIILGFCQGTQPIIGYNFGAGNMKRVKDTFFIATRITSIVCIVGLFIIQVFPEELARAFVKDEDMIRITVQGLRFCSIAFPVIAVQIVISQYFMAISKAKLSIVLSLSRQVLFLIPLMLILPKYFGLMGIWISIPISDTLSGIMAIYFIAREKQSIYGNAKISLMVKKKR